MEHLKDQGRWLHNYSQPRDYFIKEYMMHHLFWEKTLFEEALGYDKVQITIADDETEGYILCSSEDDEKPNFFILIFYNCSFFSEKEKARFVEFQAQLASEKNIQKGFWLTEKYAYVDAIVLNSVFITKIIKLLDENNRYDFLGLVAIEFSESQKHWLSLDEIQLLISDFISLEESDLLRTLKKCPFLRCFDKNRFRFSFGEFANYYVGAEFNKFNNANFKGKFKAPFSSFVIHHYIDFEATPLKALPLKELWEKFEIKKQEIIKGFQYESASKIRDLQLIYFQKLIQPHWPDFIISNLEPEMHQFEMELNQI